MPIRTPSDEIVEPAADQHVAGVLRGRDGDHLEVVLGCRRQVLQRVHRDVDLAAPQGIADRADEDAGAADLGERAGGRHRRGW